MTKKCTILITQHIDDTCTVSVDCDGQTTEYHDIEKVEYTYEKEEIQPTKGVYHLCPWE